ncbi:Uncharacterised protein [uncultured archaeon]|nr:Uncharacterised protein [uncultured archaeon]
MVTASAPEGIILAGEHVYGKTTHLIAAAIQHRTQATAEPLGGDIIRLIWPPNAEASARILSTVLVEKKGPPELTSVLDVGGLAVGVYGIRKGFSVRLKGESTLNQPGRIIASQVAVFSAVAKLNNIDAKPVDMPRLIYPIARKQGPMSDAYIVASSLGGVHLINTESAESVTTPQTLLVYAETPSDSTPKKAPPELEAQFNSIVEETAEPLKAGDQKRLGNALSAHQKLAVENELIPASSSEPCLIAEQAGAFGAKGGEGYVIAAAGPMKAEEVVKALSEKGFPAHLVELGAIGVTLNGP